MHPFSEKVFLQLTLPEEDHPVSDHKQILQALQELGYENVTVPLDVLRQLYPKCRESGFQITVTLVCRENDWILTGVEPGDRRQWHYGLAVDYGSTTIVMQLVDLHSGKVIDQVKAVNGQTA